LLGLAAPQAALAADPAPVKRGAYLAAAAGCGQCHTDKDRHGRPYAGGRPLATAFGVVPTPNLTPDRMTGIGAWSAADFERAMRWGIAPDDTRYLPTFPFPFYNRLTEADLADIRAFLASLPAVSRPNAGAGSLALWARARAAVAVAASAMAGPWHPDPRHDATWNRGAYLVATVGRCGDCHTPRTVLGAPDRHHLLAGTSAGPRGKHTPNITPDRKHGIGDWSVDDIVGLLTDGHKPDFDYVGGAMGEIVDDTAHLTDADRRAIARYLKSLPPQPGPERK
jgi:mono/diheme cytochrome c family protein